MKSVKRFVAGVTYKGRVDEYEVIANDKVHGRDLMVMFLAGGEKWTRIVVESAPGVASGAPRVIGKVG